MQNKWKHSEIFFFFSFYIIPICAMNEPRVLTSNFISKKNFPLKPHKIIPVFDSKATLQAGKSWYDVVPGTVMITPDSQGVIIGDHGKVHLLQLNNNNISKLIIEHPYVTHSPIIAMAQTKKKELLVASAGNYMDLTNQRVSEYILFCNGSSQIYKLEFPIQAIALSPYGEKLAIAGFDHVTIIDLETPEKDSKRVRTTQGDYIIDIAINSEGRAIIAAECQGGLRLMDVSKCDAKIGIHNLQLAISNDIIKKIYYPCDAELLYITHDGKAKTIVLEDLLINEYNKKINGTVFAESPLYDMVTADFSEQIATAHWTNDIKVAEDVRRRIKVYRKCNEYIEKIVLAVPALDSKYNYITNRGQYDSGVGHLLTVALRGNRVIALGTDGQLRLWSLPPKGMSDDGERKEQILSKSISAPDCTALSKDQFLKRTRSLSGGKQNKHESSVIEDDDKQKKTSSRVKLFTQLSGRSRDNSPARSREQSPARSPRKNEDEMDGKDKI
ncbi:MAG TPA: hypothetical protein VKR54_04325 [Candidatus Babeliales bacterium]|nr:hypothetical protein [Candidatus Babeliales bacterium]